MQFTTPLLLALFEDTAPTTEGGTSMVFPLVAMAAIFWFVMIAPDRKARKQRKAMLEALKKGQEVMTTGGILGKVVEVRDDRVLLQVSDNARIHFSRAAIQTVLEPKSGKESDSKAKEETSKVKDGQAKAGKGKEGEPKSGQKDGESKGVKLD